MSAKTATETSKDMHRIDRRWRNAQMLSSAVMQTLDGLLPRDGRSLREAHERLFEMFYQDGVEVVSDHDRQSLGMPPRDITGWTDMELRALDTMRVQAMLKPLGMSVTQNGPPAPSPS